MRIMLNKQEMRKAYGPHKVDLTLLDYNDDGQLVDVYGNRVNAKPVPRGLINLQVIAHIEEDYISAFRVMQALSQYLLNDYPQTSFPDRNLEGKLGFVEGFGSHNPKTEHSAATLDVPVQLYKIEAPAVQEAERSLGKKKKK